MKEDSAKPNAIIAKYVKNLHRGDFIFYEFIVEGVKYRGTVEYTPDWDTPFEWGNSCEIRYYKKDPEQNEGVLYDKNMKEETKFNGRIKVIKKKK